MNKVLLIIFLSFFITPKVFAASILFDAPKETQVGKTFIVAIYADTLGESINAVSTTVDYDENILDFKGYKSEGTTINTWIEQPYERDGQIYLAGVILGGVDALYDANQKNPRAIPLTNLIFIGKKEGMANFNFTESKILKHDGKGSELLHTNTSLQITIRGESQESDLEKDILPPDPFEITLIESSLFSKTPRMLVFNTIDESGIKGYKIKVGKGEWKEAKSPEPVRINIFTKSVTVRAEDYSGNLRDATIIIKSFVSTEFLILIILVLFLLFYELLRWSKKGKMLGFKFILFLFILSLASPVYAKEDPSASLYFSFPEKEIKIGQKLIVNVEVSSVKEAMNAVSGEFYFSNDLMRIVSLYKEGSIIDLWTEDPKTSFNKVSFEGVVFNPGYYGQKGKIFTIVFEAKKTGIANLDWNEGAVLANDGQGTNILKSLDSASFIISSFPVPVKKTEKPSSPVVEEIEDIVVEPSKEPEKISEKIKLKTIIINNYLAYNSIIRNLKIIIYLISVIIITLGAYILFSMKIKK